MDEIKHTLVDVNGLKLHVAETGSGPEVLMFLHGFPEIWYSWRHQMIAAAASGYRAIAPDYRGYGLSDPSPESQKPSLMDFVNDLVALLDALHIHKVVLIGKDFGAPLAYLLAIVQPRKVSAVISLGLPFMVKFPVHHDLLPEGFYVKRFQEPGRAEADFGRFDARTVIRTIYILFSKSDIPIAKEDQEIMDMVDPLHPLPSWLSDNDLDVYGALYQKSGFQTPLQVPYRSMQLKQSGERVEDIKIDCPSLLIMGEKDYVLKMEGMEDYIRNGEAKMIVPNLEVIFVPEGTHFVQEQFPNQVNQLILTFLEKLKSSW